MTVADGPHIHAMSITPFTADGAIDEPALRAHLRFMAEGGVGVYLCSQGSGEGDLLDAAEKIEVFRIGADELGDDTTVCAAGIGLAGPTSAIRDLAVAAQDQGVHAVQVLGPRPGPLGVRTDELERYFRTVVEAVTCDVHLSHNSVLMGYGLPLGLVEALVADYAHITTLNLSEPSFGPLITGVSDLVERFGDRLAVRVGIISELVSAHALGASGLLCFEANVAPALTSRVWEALETGDGAAIHRTFGRLLRLTVALSRGGNPRSLKEALTHLGRDGGRLREPYLGFGADEREALITALDRLGLDDADLVL